MKRSKHTQLVPVGHADGHPPLEVVCGCSTIGEYGGISAWAAGLALVRFWLPSKKMSSPLPPLEGAWVVTCGLKFTDGPLPLISGIVNPLTPLFAVTVTPVVIVASAGLATTSGPATAAAGRLSASTTMSYLPTGTGQSTKLPLLSVD